MEDKVRWGVMGCARIARNWVLPALQQCASGTLWAVASRTLETAQACATAYGITRAYGSYDALLADPDVEAIYLPLPNHLHKPWAIAALRAGKHVLCEKPIALNAAEAREMEAVSRETNRLLAEGFMYRHSPFMRQVLEIVQRGQLGELRLMHTSFSFTSPDLPTNIHLQAEAGGGCLYDIGCYAIHVQRLLAGREPRQVWAHQIVSEKHGVDIACAGTLDFDGIYGTFEVSYDAYRTNSMRIVGTNGVLQAPEGFVPRNEEASLILQTGHMVERLVPPPANPYLLELEDFSAAVRGLHPLLGASAPLDANMRVLDACLASAQSDKPVSLG